ncbi:MAG: hypothetical protein ACLU9S_09480 [Oscillospiraceae bacterium]
MYGQVREMGIPLVREVSVDAYYRSMDSDAWKSDDGYEVEERDWEIAQWQLEEMQKTDPSRGRISLTGLELVSNRWLCACLAGTIGRKGNLYKEEVYLQNGLCSMGARGRLHPVEDGWFGKKYSMPPTQISD